MSLATTFTAASGNSYLRIIDALAEHGFHPQQRGDQTMALCPVHGDTHRSLSVTYDRGNERTMLHCFTESCGANYADVLQALQLDPQAAFDKPLERDERAPRKATKRVKPKALPQRRVTKPAPPVEVPKSAWQEKVVYDYTDDEGTVVQQVVRFEAIVDGARHKRFVQRFVSPSTGRMVQTKPKDFTPVLYNQPHVKHAIATGASVWIVEGEKDADSAMAAGAIATTNSQGAGSFPDVLVQVFAGADVRIVVDRDASGAKWAASLQQKLSGLEQPATVRLYLPAVDVDKADLTDHLEHGHALDELVPITVDDARAMTAMGAIEAGASKIGEARAEAEAALEADDAEQAKAWIEESERLLQLLLAEAAKLAEPTSKVMAGLAERAAVARRRAIEDRNRAHELLDPHAAPMPYVDAPNAVDDEGNDDGDGGDDGPTEFDGTGGEDDGVPNTAPQYMVRRGQTVLKTMRESGPRYTVILDGWAEVIEEHTFDDGAEETTSRPRDQWIVKFYRWRRNEKGSVMRWPNGNRQVEEVTKKLSYEDVRTKAWVHALPWPGMLIDASTRGIATAWSAIFQARPVARTAAKRVYTSPGWRESDTGRYFVHRGGAIGKGGQLPDIVTNIDPNGPFGAYQLPDPGEADAAQLREAWQEGTVPLQQSLPARVIAPLLSTVWHSVFAKGVCVTHLVGARAAAKTGTAGLAVQYLAPLIYYRAPRSAMVSIADQGSSITGLITAAGQFGHVPAILDDAAPDGVPDKVRKKLGDFARLYFNGVPRVVGSRDGGTREQRPMKFTPITTGELTADASNASRILALPINPGDIPNVSTLYPKLETEQRRNHRALLGAALVQYIAEQWDALHAQFDDSTSQTTAMMDDWMERLKFLGDADNIRSRYAGDAVRRHVGIKLMLQMLQHRGAITQREADEFEAWAIDGLTAAYGSQETSLGDPGLQLLEHLKSALFQGTTHITTREGGAPQEDAGALGWRERTFGHDITLEPTGRGERCGVVVDNELWLLPSRTFEVAAKVAASAGEGFSETITSVGSSFVAHGWMERGNGGKNSQKRRIGGVPMNVWIVPLHVLLDMPSPDADELPAPPEIDGGPAGAAAALPTDEPATSDEARLPIPTVDETDVDEHENEQAASAEPAAEQPTAVEELPALRAELVDDVDGSEILAISSHTAPRYAPPKVASDHAFRAAVAVLDEDRLWLPDGACYRLPDIRHFGSLVIAAFLLDMGGKRGSWKVDVPTIFLTNSAATRMGIDVENLSRSFLERTKDLAERTRNHPMLVDAIADGWKLGQDDDLHVKGFTRIHAPASDGTGRYLGARIALITMNVDGLTGAIKDGPEPSALAARLQRIAERGFPYAVTPTSTGRNLMWDTVFQRRDHTEQRKTFMVPSAPIFDPRAFGSLEDDLNWSRVPSDVERSHEFVHAYDRNGSYLAGVQGTYFGVGAPTHHPDGIAYQGERFQAYYRVQLPAETPWNIPSPFGAHNDQHLGGETWVTTPTYELCRKRYDMDLPILEAYVWEQSSKALDAWAQTLSSAFADFTTDDPDDRGARGLVKSIYTQTIGSLNARTAGAEKKPGYAPERRHQIIARARANLIYRMLQIGDDSGRWPLAVLKDTVLYSSDEADPVKAWPGKPELLSPRVGHFKVEGIAPMAEQLPFFRGGGYEGKFGLER